MAADFVALTIGFYAPILLRMSFAPQGNFTTYFELFPLLPVIMILFASAGLYPGILVARHEELKKTTLITLSCIGAFLVTTFFLRTVEQYSRLALIGSSLLTVGLLPFARIWVRHLFARKPWWGEPAVLVGSNNDVDHYQAYFEKFPELGIQIVDTIKTMQPQSDETLQRLEAIAHSKKIPMLFCVMESDAMGNDYVHWLEDRFRRILFVPRAMVRSLNVTIHDFGGIQFLQSHTKWHDPVRRFIKRALDISLVTITAPLFFPFMGIVAVIIRAQSPGPAIYRQQRIGHDGKVFPILKFRTMVQNADEVLAEHLQNNPALAEEWEQTQKLHDDPRVTKIGKFLRRTSIDELPQLINVLKGEMSLVGPRPIVDEEISRYGKAFTLYSRSYPGITGLWQISGRSETTYAERVRLDSCYIRSWSVWLDLYILSRTLWVVIKGNGAC